MTDIGGNTTYSKTVSVRNLNGSAISIYPNPVMDVMNVTISSEQQAEATVLITDLSGKTVMQQIQQLSKGMNNLVLDAGSLAKGSYMLKIIANNKTHVQQFNVQ